MSLEHRETRFKDLPKYKALRPDVPDWIEFKREQVTALKGVVHREENFILCKDKKPWGHDLHVTVHAPSDPEKISGIIIAFHGLGNFGQAEYYYFAPWFAKKGYIVIAPDLPYFGHNVLHRGVHGRIGKWVWQMDAMSESIKWALEWASDYSAGKYNAKSIPWSIVGISMSGLGVLYHGLFHLTGDISAEVLKNCRGITSLVPALEFLIPISPLQKLGVYLISAIAPNFIYTMDPVPDPDTGYTCGSHDLESVAWCSPCIEQGKDFGLLSEHAEEKFQIDCFPSAPLSTIKKIYLAAAKARKNASKWPNIPIFCTGSSKDDLVDPKGVKRFIDGINQSIEHQYRLYEGWYHSQLCEKDREELFSDILKFIEKKS